MELCTIGFTKSTAEHFFERMKAAGVQVVLDVRLKNTSQLAGFARMPDIEYFLKNLVGSEYVHDPLLAPTEEILSAYKKKMITWREYEVLFNRLMEERGIDAYILERYAGAAYKGICLLCSESGPEHCHRRLLAERMGRLMNMETIHL